MTTVRGMTLFFKNLVMVFTLFSFMLPAMTWLSSNYTIILRAIDNYLGISL